MTVAAPAVGAASVVDEPAPAVAVQVDERAVRAAGGPRELRGPPPLAAPAPPVGRARGLEDPGEAREVNRHVEPGDAALARPGGQLLCLARDPEDGDPDLPLGRAGEEEVGAGRVERAVEQHDE